MIQFRRSLTAILNLIARHQNADAVAVYEYSSDKSSLSLAAAASVPCKLNDRLDASEALRESLQVAGYFSISRGEVNMPGPSTAWLQNFAHCLLVTIQSSGKILYVAWETPRRHLNVEGVHRLGAALDLLFLSAAEENTIHSLQLELERLQRELADFKIAERTVGLLSANANSSEVADVVHRHVARVLESVEDTASVSKRVAALRDELGSRRRIAQAKQILQSRQGLSEQEAYLELQSASRRSRRALSQIADEVLGAHPP